MKRFWNVAVVVVALLALGGAAVGFVAAQEGGTATPAPEAQQAKGERFVALLADNLGITVDQLEQAVRETQLELVDEALADGRLTEDQAARIRERIESGEAPLFPHRPHHRACRGAHVVGEVAEFLQVPVEDVVSGLQDGQSLVQIAEAHGKTPDELAAFLLSELEEYLAQAVENGRITQERADEILAKAPERIDQVINHEGPPLCERPGGPAPEGTPATEI